MKYIKDRKINNLILLITILFGLLFYSIIFISNLNNFFEKEEYLKKRVLNYEKQKLNSTFSSLMTYSDYINLRLNSSTSINTVERYIQIQKILSELNTLAGAGKDDFIINIYDQTNENFFNGALTNKLHLIKDPQLKNILETTTSDSLYEIDKEIVLVKQIFSLDDFLILLRIPKKKILTNNNDYSLFITENTENISSSENFLTFKYLNKNFIIQFSNKFIYNIRYIFIYFLFPLIGVIISSVILYHIIFFFFSKYLKTLFEKIQGEELPNTTLYLDDLYDELIKRNKFILEKSKEVEKIFNERVISDFILGIIPYKEISDKLQLPQKVYCGILNIKGSEINLDDYLYSIKKLIHNFESKNIKLLLLEKEHIFMISSIPFILEELSIALTFFGEEELIDIFGIISNKECFIEDLPKKKIELEKLLIYKERLKDNILIDEDTISSLSFECSYFYPINTEQKLINKIQNFDLNGTLDILKNIFNINFVEQTLSADSIKRLKRIIVNSLEKIIIHLEIKNGFQDKEYFIKRDLLSNDEFQSKSLKILKQINESYKSDKVIENSSEAKMKSFIKENFNREVSLLEFAEYMNFTPQYLSNIYKKTFGENFNISLNRYRIQKSIELFIDHKGEIKIKELGEMVGYTNTITFINNFKKFKNTTPTNFFEKYLRTKEQYLNS